jgi:redox-sensitive bicupin YhaK (pirin superfamily)
MSNLETKPPEVVAGEADACGFEILEPRDVPLGGPRAMEVRRTLPQRARSLIGAWCFVDHYGPDAVARTHGMNVPPHPHTGLQTVSWLFAGEIEHRDSTGAHAMVRPGELNLMTAGSGIQHSEVSTTATTMLHGAQLWVALPDAHRHTAPFFEHYAPTPIVHEGATVHVLLGSLLGETSTATMYTPLVGAQIDIPAGLTVRIPVDPTFEHGILVDAGDLRVRTHFGAAEDEHLGAQPDPSPIAESVGELDAHSLAPTDPLPVAEAVPVNTLAYLAPGRTELVLTAGDEPVRAILIGGTPLGERIVMWWNFIGRTHDEIAAYRAQWQAEVIGELVSSAVGAVGAVGSPAVGAVASAAAPSTSTYPSDPASLALPNRFGHVEGYDGKALPAPVLPNVRLRPRE